MTIQEFYRKLQEQPEELTFADTMETVDANYTFKPTKFKNGEVTNEAGYNSGSCKLFAFAKIQGFSDQQTLNCFGEYFRNDVLKNPKGTDHQNIRNFIIHKWNGISFEANALIPNTED